MLFLLYESADVVPAELPLTLLRHFTIGSTLRWLMSAILWPDVSYYRQIVQRFFQAHGHPTDSVPGAEPQDSRDSGGKRPPGTSFTLEPEDYSAILVLINKHSTTRFVSQDDADLVHPILDDKARSVRKVEMNGRIYGTISHSRRNSFVLFRQADSTGATPGQILSIFDHTRKEDGTLITESFLVVRAFAPLDPRHESFDPYRVYPELDTRLYYASTENSPTHILRIQDVVSHFAAHFYEPRGIGRQCVVVRSLDQAGPTFGIQ